jgi:hypothetical protein
MIRRVALGGVLASVVTIGVAYAAAFFPGGAPAWAAWALAGGTALLMASSTALGAVRGDRLGWVWLPVTVILVVVGGGFWWTLGMRGGETSASPLWLGLPRRAAVILFGVGLIPLFVVPVTYALTFDEMALPEEELVRIRSEVHARAAPAPASTGEEG